MTTIADAITAKSQLKIAECDPELLKEIQFNLKRLGYYNLSIDGVFGVGTQQAWIAFKKENHLGSLDLVGESSLKKLIEATPRLEEVPLCAINLIKEFEGFSSIAYRDTIHGWDVPTIGYGTIKYLNGRKVSKGDVCTVEDALI